MESNYKHLKVFGCKCFLLNDENDKLSYICYDKKKGKIYVSRNITFLENENGRDKTEPKHMDDYAFLWTNDEHDDISSSS